MKERRMVQCLHKLNDERSGLAVGKTFRFQSGDAYTVQASGALVSANPKSYQGKAGRKQWLQLRREERERQQRMANRKLQMAKPLQHGIKIVFGDGPAMPLPPGWRITRNRERPAVATSPTGDEFLIGDGKLYPWSVVPASGIPGSTLKAGARYVDIAGAIAFTPLAFKTVPPSPQPSPPGEGAAPAVGGIVESQSPIADREARV